jgi:hypothetical protein
MPEYKMHPVIAKLQGDTNPVSAVKEMLVGVSIVAQAVGVQIQYTVAEQADPNTTPDATAYQTGLRHLHSALAMLGVRAQNVLTNSINKTRKLPHVPIKSSAASTSGGTQGPPPAVGQTGN